MILQRKLFKEPPQDSATFFGNAWQTAQGPRYGIMGNGAFSTNGYSVPNGGSRASQMAMDSGRMVVGLPYDDDCYEPWTGTACRSFVSGQAHLWELEGSEWVYKASVKPVDAG